MKVCIAGANPAWQKTLSFAELRYNGVNRARAVDCFASGKGINFARAAVIGERIQPLIVQFSGGANGEMLEEALDVEGLPYRSVAIAAETRCCTTCLGEADHSMTELIEPAPLVAHAELEEYLELIELETASSAMLAICGTTPRFESECDFYAECGRIAQKHGKYLLIDAYMNIDTLLELNSEVILKINAAELAALTRCDFIADGMRALRTAHPNLNVAITDGGNPAYLGCPHGVFRYDLPTIQVVNPIGSGDSASAILAGEFLAGIPLEQAFLAALGAGMANCLTVRCAEFAPAVARGLTRQIRMTRLE